MTIEDLLSIFHQMGHIQYFLQYKNLSVIFRAGANPAFEEAVGSVVTLSASSHKHLLNRGLLSQVGEPQNLLLCSIHSLLHLTFSAGNSIEN